MRQTFVLNIKPFSVNQMFTVRNFKTVAYKDWEQFAIHELSRPDVCSCLKSIKDAFDPKKHALIVSLTMYFPKSVLYTASGQLSGRAYDLSNVEKPLLDLICLEKYQIKSGIDNLGIDDKFVISLTSKKRPSMDDSFKIRVSISVVSI